MCLYKTGAGYDGLCLSGKIVKASKYSYQESKLILSDVFEVFRLAVAATKVEVHRLAHLLWSHYWMIL